MVVSNLNTGLTADRVALPPSILNLLGASPMLNVAASGAAKTAFAQMMAVGSTTQTLERLRISTTGMSPTLAKFADLQTGMSPTLAKFADLQTGMSPTLAKFAALQTGMSPTFAKFAALQIHDTTAATSMLATLERLQLPLRLLKQHDSQRHDLTRAATSLLRALESSRAVVPAPSQAFDYEVLTALDTLRQSGRGSATQPEIPTLSQTSMLEHPGTDTWTRAFCYARRYGSRCSNLRGLLLGAVIERELSRVPGWTPDAVALSIIVALLLLELLSRGPDDPTDG